MSQIACILFMIGGLLSMPLPILENHSLDEFPYEVADVTSDSFEENTPVHIEETPEQATSHLQDATTEDNAPPVKEPAAPKKALEPDRAMQLELARKRLFGNSANAKFDLLNTLAEDTRYSDSDRSSEATANPTVWTTGDAVVKLSEGNILIPTANTGQDSDIRSESIDSTTNEQQSTTNQQQEYDLLGSQKVPLDDPGSAEGIPLEHDTEESVPEELYNSQIEESLFRSKRKPRPIPAPINQEETKKYAREFRQRAFKKAENPENRPANAKPTGYKAKRKQHVTDVGSVTPDADDNRHVQSDEAGQNALPMQDAQEEYLEEASYIAEQRRKFMTPNPEADDMELSDAMVEDQRLEENMKVDGGNEYFQEVEHIAELRSKFMTPNPEADGMQMPNAMVEDQRLEENMNLDGSKEYFQAVEHIAELRRKFMTPNPEADGMEMSNAMVEDQRSEENMKEHGGNEYFKEVEHIAELRRKFMTPNPTADRPAADTDERAVLEENLTDDIESNEYYSTEEENSEASRPSQARALMDEADLPPGVAVYLPESIEQAAQLDGSTDPHTSRTTDTENGENSKTQITACKYSKVSFTVSKYSSIKQSLRWYKNNRPIEDDFNNRMRYAGNLLECVDCILEISDVSAYDEGVYDAVIQTNSSSLQISFALDVIDTNLYMMEASPKLVDLHDDVIVRVKANYDGDAEWTFYNGSAMRLKHGEANIFFPNHQDYEIEKGSVMLIKDVQLGNLGEYKVDIKKDGCQGTSAIQLELKPAAPLQRTIELLERLEAHKMDKIDRLERNNNSERTFIFLLWIVFTALLSCCCLTLTQNMYAKLRKYLKKRRYYRLSKDDELERCHKKPGSRSKKSKKWWKPFANKLRPLRRLHTGGVYEEIYVTTQSDSDIPTDISNMSDNDIYERKAKKSSEGPREAGPAGTEPESRPTNPEQAMEAKNSPK